MKLRYLLAGSVIAALIVAGLLVAQQPAVSEDPVEGTAEFRTGTLNVLVPVTVTDRNGKFVNNLTPVDFQLLDNGIPQRITEDVALRPISLVLAIQANSATSQILPTIPKVAPMFDSLVIGETGELSILAFDHRIQELTPGFTSDPDVIKASLAKLKPGGSQSHMDDAAMQGVRMLRNRGQDRKKIMILVSETRDRGSAVNPRDVLTQAEFSDVQIYSVSMNHLINQLTSKTEPNRPNAIPPENRPMLPMGTIQTGTTDAQTNMGNYVPIFKEIFALVKGIFVPNSLEVYTKFTGGREHNFVGLSGLEEAIRNIGEEIHSQYLLSFNPGKDAESGYHEIRVLVGRPELTVRPRPGYWIAPMAR